MYAARMNAEVPLEVQLFWACRLGQVERVRRLLDAGANVETHWNSSLTAYPDLDVSPLHVATRYGHLAVARLLLERGANPHRANGHSHSPLIVACKLPLSSVTVPNREAKACALANLLLNFGAEVDATDDRGWEPLIHAVSSSYNSPELVQILLDRGASVLTGRNSTSVYIAADRRNLGIVRLLLERGALVDPGYMHANPTRGTPLYNAVRILPHLGLARLLLAHGASFDRVCRDPDGSLKTPLSLVRDGGHLEMNALFDAYLKLYWRLRVKLRVFGSLSEHLLDLHVAPYLIGDGILSKKRS